MYSVARDAEEEGAAGVSELHWAVEAYRKLEVGGEGFIVKYKQKGLEVLNSGVDVEPASMCAFAAAEKRSSDGRHAALPEGHMGGNT